MIFKIKKGELLIRDVVTMMLLVSAVIVLTSTFVTEMAGNYGNTAMENEYALSNTSIGGSDLFSSTRTDVINASDKIQDEEGGLVTLITGAKDIVTGIVKIFLTAPNNIGGLVEGALIDMNVDGDLSNTIKWIIVVLIWIIIIFSIITAFLQGAKV